MSNIKEKPVTIEEITEPAKNDPQVSCCIVCSEYMRATGFFYESDKTYLVTARHNALPTDANVIHPANGAVIHSVSTDNYLPKIDIYLRSGAELTKKQMDLRDVDSDDIMTDKISDILAVSIPFDPREWGYTVFNDDDVSVVSEEDNSITSYAFLRPSLPDTDEYAVSTYRQNLAPPCELTIDLLDPEASKRVEKILGIGLLDIPLKTGELNGMSGAPWLGDGLVGIHSATSSFPAGKFGGPSDEEWKRIAFYSSAILRDVLP